MQSKSKNNQRTLVGGLIAFVLLVSVISTSLAASVENSKYELQLDFSNLAQPGDDHYEGWLIIDGTPVSTGKFSLDGQGRIVDLNGNLVTDFSLGELDLMGATKFVLTLEHKGDSDTLPADIKLLAGDLNTARTTASLTHNVGVDLSDVYGGYLLATPSHNFPTLD